MTYLGIECGHYLTVDGKSVGWVLRAGVVNAGQKETVWIETVQDYDLVTDYVKLPTEHQGKVQPRTTTLVFLEDLDDRMELQ